MKKLVMLAIGLFLFCETVLADSFQQPKHGFDFQDIQKITQEVQRLYEGSLHEYLLQYTQGILKFTSKTCQIRDPQIGCLTFHKNQKSWNLRVDFKTSRVLKLYGFHQLILLQEKNKRRWLRLYDREGRVIRFPFRRGKIQKPILPFMDTTIAYETIENIVSGITTIYEGSLKKPMQRYSGEQWIYPLSPCDRDLLNLGCVSYGKNPQIWLILVKLNQEWRQELSGFHQIIFRNRADGLGELELQNLQSRSLYFPIINWNLKDIFLPMPLKKKAPSKRQTSLVK